MLKHALFTTLSCCILLSACSNTEQSENSNLSLKESFAIAAEGTHRSEQHKKRNIARHPAETLDFFGIQKGMTVLEITPGGLWYTEVLAPALKNNGQLIVAGYDLDVEGQPKYRYKQQVSMEARFANESQFSKVSIVKFSPPHSIELGENNSVDAVVTFRNYHGWIRDGIAQTNTQAFYNVLKPGGIFGVVQHRGETHHDKKTGNINGYVPEEKLIEIAEKAGFVLVEKSEINANPKDSKHYQAGVWTLPPSLRLGEKDRDKYLAIGESDRMTLKFTKPK